MIKSIGEHNVSLSSFFLLFPSPSLSFLCRFSSLKTSNVPIAAWKEQERNGEEEGKRKGRISKRKVEGKGGTILLPSLPLQPSLTLESCIRWWASTAAIKVRETTGGTCTRYFGRGHWCDSSCPLVNCDVYKEGSESLGRIELCLPAYVSVS